MVNEIKLNKDNIKDFMLMQSIEKTMRRIKKDIRRFQPKVDKAVKNYNNHIKRVEEMKYTLKQFELKRDSILSQMETPNPMETSINQ